LGRNPIIVSTHTQQSIIDLAIKHARAQIAARHAKRLAALADRRAAIAAKIKQINKQIDDSVDVDAVSREVLTELITVQTSGQANSIAEAFELLAKKYGGDDAEPALEPELDAAEVDGTDEADEDDESNDVADAEPEPQPAPEPEGHSLFTSRFGRTGDTSL
jgi:TATA-binding protein-associated factor Taf7